MYSFSNRKYEDVLEYCKAQNIAFIPWFPLNAGDLTAEKLLGEIAAAHNATTHQIALAWLFQHAENILLIPGTSKVAHQEQNVKVSDIILTPAEKSLLNDVAK